MRILVWAFLICSLTLADWAERVVHTLYITYLPDAPTPNIDYVQPDKALSYLLTNNDSISHLAPEYLSSFAMSFFRIVVDINIATVDQASLISRSAAP